jgi:hypothetical protein
MEEIHGHLTLHAYSMGDIHHRMAQPQHNTPPNMRQRLVNFLNHCFCVACPVSQSLSYSSEEKARQLPRSVRVYCARKMKTKIRKEERKKHRYDYRTIPAVPIGTRQLRLFEVDQFNQSFASPSFRRREVQELQTVLIFMSNVLSQGPSKTEHTEQREIVLQMHNNSLGRSSSSVLDAFGSLLIPFLWWCLWRR